MAKFVVTGDKALLRKLNKLSTKAANKVVRQAMRAAGKPILEAAKQNAPEDKGVLKKSIKLRALKRKKGRIGVRVGSAKKDYTGETYYGSFIEYGTENMPAHPYLRPAFDSKKSTAERIARQKIAEGIKREAKNG